MSKITLIAADGALGDTLAITSVVRKLYELHNEKISVATMYPDIWENNPYVNDILKYTYNTHYDTNISPCRTWSCNIIENCFSQLGLKYDKDILPELYLSKSEILYAKDIFKKYTAKKKIVVCLNSSADIRDIRYDNILPLLKKLKELDCKLISISKYSSIKYSNSNQIVCDTESIFDENLNNTTLREVFSIINECDLYLGVDTGLLQAAAALNKPQVAFFTNNGCANKAYKNTQYIESNIECSSDCKTAPLSNCMANNRCMDNFDLDMYFNLIKKILW